MPSPCIEAVNTCVMRIHSGEKAGARGNAGSRLRKSEAKGNTAFAQGIEVRCAHVRLTTSTNRVGPLLVYNDENNIWRTLHG